MIPTTNAYKEAIKDNRILHNQVKITFSDGNTKTVGDAGLFQFSITDEVSNTGSFDMDLQSRSINLSSELIIQMGH